jgi:hypothetical protein
MASASTREAIKSKDRTVSVMTLEAVCSYEKPITILIRQTEILTCESVVKVS